MYNPQHFQITDVKEISNIISEYSFGTIISHNTGLLASHLPFIYDPDLGNYGVLWCHFAKANDHWRYLESCDEVLTIFSGPHTYISPSWYQRNNSVPTWNYVAVHAYGKASILDATTLQTVLERTVSKYESNFFEPWTMELPSREYLQARIEHIVGIRVDLTRIEAKKKLSQNMPNEVRNRIRTNLINSKDPNALAVAQLMTTEDND